MPRPRFFAHANVNTTDVDRAEAFYINILELTPKWRTAPSHPQDGSGFGMPGVEVQWRGGLPGGPPGGYGAVVGPPQLVVPPPQGGPDARRPHPRPAAPV